MEIFRDRGDAVMLCSVKDPGCSVLDSLERRNGLVGETIGDSC
jgi:hypothetical protein